MVRLRYIKEATRGLRVIRGFIQYGFNVLWVNYKLYLVVSCIFGYVDVAVAVFGG